MHECIRECFRDRPECDLWLLHFDPYDSIVCNDYYNTVCRLFGAIGSLRGGRPYINYLTTSVCLNQVHYSGETCCSAHKRKCYSCDGLHAQFLHSLHGHRVLRARCDFIYEVHVLVLNSHVTYVLLHDEYSPPCVVFDER